MLKKNKLDMKKFLKCRWKEILASFVMIVSASILAFQLLAPFKRFTIKPHAISHMGEYYQLLDDESKNYVRNNIFSVFYFPKAAEDPNWTTFGTCWSFYHDDNFWYLMTNHHVIEQIQEQAFWSHYDPSAGTLRCSRSGHNLYDVETKGIVGREIYYDDYMLFESNVDENNKIRISAENASVIYTQLNEIKHSNQTAKRIFADVDWERSKQFQVDMALIKVSYDSLVISRETKYGNRTHLNAFDWIAQNTYSFEIEYPQLKDKLPTKLKGDGDKQPLYYTAGYPSAKGMGKTVFIDGILDGKITQRASPLEYKDRFTKELRRAANAWATTAPFIENAPTSSDPNGWKMSGGSSGSPLLEIEQDKLSGLYRFKRKTPIAIYWGGGVFEYNNNKMFFPIYDLFCNDQSNQDVMPYNILQNCYSFLKSPKNVLDSLK